MSDKEWDQVMEVHLKGAFSCTKAAWPLFRKQKFGRVINTASAAGLYGMSCLPDDDLPFFFLRRMQAISDKPTTVLPRWVSLPSPRHSLVKAPSTTSNLPLLPQYVIVLLRIRSDDDKHG